MWEAPKSNREAYKFESLEFPGPCQRREFGFVWWCVEFFLHTSLLSSVFCPQSTIPIDLPPKCGADLLPDSTDSAVGGNFMPSAFSIREKQENLPHWGQQAAKSCGPWTLQALLKLILWMTTSARSHTSLETDRKQLASPLMNIQFRVCTMQAVGP